jgi:hypothetical protein
LSIFLSMRMVNINHFRREWKIEKTCLYRNSSN